MPEVIHSVNLDANESAFLSRELEQVKARAYEQEYPDRKGVILFPVSTELHPGVESFVWRMFDRVGMAEIITNYANNLPQADVEAKEFTQKVFSIGIGYHYSHQEIRAAQFAGRPLTQQKANAAREAHEYTVDDLIWFGSDAHGIYGILNHPNITAYAVDEGAGGDTRWAPVSGVTTKTPDEVIQDVKDLLNGIKSLTKGIESADTVLLPPDEYAHIASTRISDYSERTILEYLNKIFPAVSFEEVSEMADLNPARIGTGDSTNVMLAYRRSADKLEVQIPMQFTQHPAQEQGLAFEVPCESRYGGFQVVKPLSIALAEGI